MRSRSTTVLARTVRGFFALCVLVLAVAASGCGGGLFGMDAPKDDMVVSGAAKKATSEGVPDGTVMKYEEGEADPLDRPEGEPVLIWKAGNDGAIEGGGGKPPTVKQDGTYFVTEVCAYHWNDGKGAPAGEITLKAADGTTYGPWKTTLRNGVYWIAQPNQDLPAGTYTFIDSDPSTWAQNSASGGAGMGWAYGIPVK